MKTIGHSPNSSLSFQTSSLANRVAHDKLVRDVFEVEAEATLDPAWRSFGFYLGEERCVASIDIAILTLSLNGTMRPVGAIRHAAVDPDWRGEGLFRDLMLKVLAWCDETSLPTLLYTEDASLYRRFGFSAVAQHRFVGVGPGRVDRQPAEAVDIGSRADIRARLTVRAPVSWRCALVGAADLVLGNLRASGLSVAWLPDLETLVVYEFDDDTLVLADIVAERIPPLVEITARLPARAEVTTLFSPDLLDWAGEPILDDTGLMARGDLPLASRPPFMLPPTVEF